MYDDEHTLPTGEQSQEALRLAIDDVDFMQ
jgi:hypothetical protein